MITVGTTTLALDDPRLWAAALGVVFALVLLRAVLRASRAVEPLARHLADLDGAVRALNDGQQQLHGGITHVAEAQAAAQARLAASLEARLGEVTTAMGESLGQNAVRTARSLGELQQRLETIDRAQVKIEKLSGDVLGLQDILSNKQTRGAFGEIQLREIVTRALPPDAVAFQATLSNGTRADCLIHLPNPPGPIVIDAKFPLEPYEALRAAKTPAETQAAQRLMRGAVRAHMKAIAEKYVIEGETAEGALMFLPSEAVYAELHASFGDLVREGFGDAGLDRLADHLHGDAAHAPRGAEGRTAARGGARHPPRARAAAQGRRAAGGAGGEPRPPLRPGAEGHRGDQDLRRAHPGPRPPAGGDRLRRGDAGAGDGRRPDAGAGSLAARRRMQLSTCFNLRVTRGRPAGPACAFARRLTASRTMLFLDTNAA